MSLASDMLPRVKPELVDPFNLHSLPPFNIQSPQDLGAQGPQSNATSVRDPFQADPQQPTNSNNSKSVAPVPGPTSAHLYEIYASAYDIAYTPEKAMKQGLGMIKTIKKEIQKLELGSRMRKEVWLREIASLESRKAPTALIAVCGATGAGKSSLLNAILDDNIVPTSGMRACTAVVTEIAYHDKPTIDADVSFLTLQEWKDELEVLLHDFVGENGNVRRVTDLRSEAGVAWHKVHAVYPTIDQDQLARMTADQIVACDPRVAEYLGVTKHICAKDSKAFAVEISKYIDSKDQKRDQKNGLKRKGEKRKEEKNNGKKDKKKDAEGTTENADNEPALWPLIRQVVVKCNSTVLSTGAILVDLPGVADANVARNSISKDYMKKCNCIWVLAPISRAVDDCTAKDLLGDAFKIQLKMDGKYDDSAITFIATKADDISCSEVIRGLKLEDDEDIRGIKEKINAIKEDRKKWKTIKTAAERAVKAIAMELNEASAVQMEYRQHLKAFEDSKSFGLVFTGQNAAAQYSSTPRLGKRERVSSDNEKSPKRWKDGDDDEGSEDIDTEDEEDSRFDSSKSGLEDVEGTSFKSEEEVEDAMDAEEEVTEESLKAKLEETIALIGTLNTRLSRKMTVQEEATDKMINADDRLAKAQIEKNGICSFKRSEFSREVLKENFRSGLREIDEAEAQERDPDSFDPTQQLRNYNDIDLPTFCVSARDYFRITKQDEGDGKPNCFTDVNDTEIPELQKWCQSLTVLSRQHAARMFLMHLRTFITSAIAYVEGITEVKEEDCNALGELWQSQIEENDDEDGDETDASGDEDITTKKTRITKFNLRGEPMGIMVRLTKGFERVVDDAVAELKGKFEDGLNDKLKIGTAKAAAKAVEVSDKFAASMHWGTYRATLRRDGVFRQCLNTKLLCPLTKSIASSWARVFEADLFASFEARTLNITTKLLEDVENAATPCLKDRVKQQAEITLDEVKVAMKSLVTVVRDVLDKQQKEVSRCLVPHIQAQLRSGYNQASEERGPGSVARQKALFHNFISTVQNHVFNDGADRLLENLGKTAESIGDALGTALGEIAKKVKVSMSLLWEYPRHDARQAHMRREALETLRHTCTQVDLWSTAEKINSRMRD